MSCMTPFPFHFKRVSRYGPSLFLHDEQPSCHGWEAENVPMLTVEALPADCRPRKMRSTGKLGEMLSIIFAIM